MTAKFWNHRLQPWQFLYGKAECLPDFEGLNLSKSDKENFILDYASKDWENLINQWMEMWINPLSVFWPSSILS